MLKRTTLLLLLCSACLPLFCQNTPLSCDSKNYHYRPIINGKIEKLKFIIYNRFGEKVFESSDPFKGWDGTYKGKPQDSNTFVWYCSYQFAGELLKTEKGTVILVR